MGFQATIVQKKLQDAGFDARQALTIASVLETDVVADLDERLVTRAHFDAARAQTDAKIAELAANMVAMEARIEKRLAGFESRMAAFESRMSSFDAKLDMRIAELRAEMIKWMVGLVAGSTLTIILAMLRLVK